MKKKKIIAAGHLSLDITPGFPDSGYKSISELLRPGKLLNMENVTVSVGGSVSNTGLALKLLGADVMLIAKIADDAFGSIVDSIYAKWGAQKDLIHAAGEQTSFTIILAPPGIDRIFLHDMGCNATFCCADLDFARIAKADHFHFGYPPLMRSMYQNGAEETLRLFRRVKELGLTTSLDMAAVEEGSDAAKEDWARIVRSLLPWVDFFVPSIEELGYMIDPERYHTWQRKAGSSDITSILSVEEDIRPLANLLISWGAKCVLIKCGAAGMFLKTASAEVMRTIGPQYESWGSLEHFEKSYVPERVLSATGAGDTSIAAFLEAAIDLEYPPLRCVQLAAAEGASCVTAYDSLSGLKPLDKLIARIDAGWPKV